MIELIAVVSPMMPRAFHADFATTGGFTGPFNYCHGDIFWFGHSRSLKMMMAMSVMIMT